VHFGKQCGGAAIAERPHVENAEAALEGRGGETGKERLLEEEIGFRGSGDDPTGEVTHSSEDLGRKSTDDVNIADIAVGRQTSKREFGLSMLEPASRVIQPKGRKS
jgi:hypothetical protein